MEMIISHKAKRAEVTNTTVRGTPGSENLMTMHAPTMMSVAPHTSSLPLMEDFIPFDREAAGRLIVSLRPSFMGAWIPAGVKSGASLLRMDHGLVRRWKLGA
jgi:hypothetical protein